LAVNGAGCVGKQAVRTCPSRKQWATIYPDFEPVVPVPPSRWFAS
jgi:hypothetical protein